MLRASTRLAVVAAGLALGAFGAGACTGEMPGAGAGGEDGQGGGQGAGQGGAAGQGPAAGVGGQPGGGSVGATGGAAPGSGGATATVDAGRDAGGGADLGGADAARPPVGGNSGSGGRGVGGATGAGGTAGALPPITIWIAGDSTVATGTAPCPIGWGGQFKPLFNAQVAVTNSAIAGRSVRTWLYFPTLDMDASGECVLPRDAAGNPTVQSRWQAMLNAMDGMKAGDYLFIQFGINDSSATCDRHVGLEAFKTSYGVMAQAAKDRGAHPIFLTPTSSISCNSANVAVGTRGGYVTATLQAGTQFAVPVIDLHALTVARYNALRFCPIPGGGDISATTTGPVGDYFCDDHTHYSPSGAVDIAALVAGGVRSQVPALAAYLR